MLVIYTGILTGMQAVMSIAGHTTVSHILFRVSLLGYALG